MICFDLPGIPTRGLFFWGVSCLGMEKLIGEQSQELELNVTWDSLDGDCVPEEEHAELNRSPADGREAQGLPRIAAMEKDEEAVD